LVSAACTSVKIVKHQPGLRPELIQKAMNLSGYLKENGIIVPCVQYPVKMNKVLVRITVSVNHTRDQIENLLIILKQWRSKHQVASD